MHERCLLRLQPCYGCPHLLKGVCRVRGLCCICRCESGDSAACAARHSSPWEGWRLTWLISLHQAASMWMHLLGGAVAARPGFMVGVYSLIKIEALQICCALNNTRKRHSITSMSAGRIDTSRIRRKRVQQPQMLYGCSFLCSGQSAQTAACLALAPSSHSLGPEPKFAGCFLTCCRNPSVW